MSNYCRYSNTFLASIHEISQKKKEIKLNQTKTNLRSMESAQVVSGLVHTLPLSPGDTREERD